MWKRSSRPAVLLIAPRGVSGANGDARSRLRGSEGDVRRLGRVVPLMRADVVLMHAFAASSGGALLLLVQPRRSEHGV
jgi:hypothetical protein